jgi:hypothetical protein
VWFNSRAAPFRRPGMFTNIGGKQFDMPRVLVGMRGVLTSVRDKLFSMAGVLINMPAM